MKIEAEIYINNELFRIVPIQEENDGRKSIQVDISIHEIEEKKIPGSSPEIESIEDLIQENVHKIRRRNMDESSVAKLIEYGDISIRLKGDQGKFHKMIQVLDLNYKIFPKNIDFFECDVDISEFGFYLLCYIKPHVSASYLSIVFSKIRNEDTIKAVLESRENRDLCLMDVGSGICLNVKSLSSNVEDYEDHYEIEHIFMLQRLLLKIQGDRLTKRSRLRLYKLGERSLNNLQRRAEAE